MGRIRNKLRYTVGPIRNAGGLINLFLLDMNTEFFKFRQFVTIEDLKISFYTGMQKFSLF